MNSLLLLVSFSYLVGTTWYYEVDWKNKDRIFIIPSEVLYFMASLAIIAVIYFLYYNTVVIIKFGNLYIYLFSTLLLISVFMHMVAKHYEDREKFKGIRRSWRDELHNIHGYISHNLVYCSILGILSSFSLIEISEGIVVLGDYNVYLILLSSFLFALSFYRTIVHGRLWRIQILMIPIVTLLIIYMLLMSQSNIWELPFSLFTVMTLGMSFVMLSYDEVFVRKLKN